MWKIVCIYEPKFLLLFMQVAVLIVIIISTRAVFLEKMTSFSPILNQDLEQGKLMVAANSRCLGNTYCI